MYIEGEIPSITTNGNNGANFVYPVMPYGYGMGGFGGGFGGGYGFGGDAIWIIVLLALFGGFGNGFGGNNNMLYDINANTNRGFDNLALNNGIDNLQTAVSNGFANAQVQNCNSTTELLQAINGVNSTFQNCCCENRLATADLKSTIIQENCQDREVINLALRDVIASNTANTQAILDKLCQQEIDAKNETISNLRTQLNMQNLAASQTAQTAQLIQDNNAQTRDLIQRIAPYPTPSYIVANPYAYNYGYNNGCGCGCGAN